MPRPSSFWRNVVLIGAVHVAILVGLTRWGGAAKKPLTTDIVWMESGLAETAAPVAAPEPAAPNEPPAEEAPLVPEPEEAPPIPTAVESEPPPPTPTPRPSATPKATPKPTPKKALLAKSSPKPSATPAKKKLAQTKKDTRSTAPKKTTVTATSATGASGANAGSANAAQFSWYGNMLHDRFFSEWVQPKSAVMSGARMSALVRLRIEKDGRISDFAIVRSSGNVVVDESVAAVAKRVTQVDPLPAGLGSGGSYSVNINFELNPE